NSRASARPRGSCRRKTRQHFTSARCLALRGSALVEAARQALLAPLLVDKGRLTALLTQVADLLSPVTIHYGLVRERLPLANLLGEGAGEGGREREDLGGAEACRLAAADPREMGAHFFEPPLRRQTRTESEHKRNQRA